MFDINGWEFLVLILLGLFIFGPERLPKLVGDAARTIRQLRAMARNATSELSESLGTEVALEDLNPKTFVRKHLLSEEDERVLRRPFEDAFAQIREVSETVTEATTVVSATKITKSAEVTEVTKVAEVTRTTGVTEVVAGDGGVSADPADDLAAAGPTRGVARYDEDAT